MVVRHIFLITLHLEINLQNPDEELICEQREILFVVHFSVQDYLNILMISYLYAL